MSRTKVLVVLGFLVAVSACSNNPRRSASAAYALAAKLSNSARCADAIPLYAEAIDKDSTILMAYDGLARCEEVHGSYHLAAEIASSGLAVSPKNADLYQLRSDIEFNEGTYQRTLATAIEDEVKSADFVTPSASAYLAIAAKLSDMTAYPEAVKMVDRAIPLAADRSPLYVLRGFYYLSGGELSLALRDFRLAEASASTKDESADAYAHESLVYLQEHSLDKAETSILAAITRIPRSYSYAMYAVRVYDAGMDPKKAFAMANRAVRLATDVEEAASARKARADEAVRLGEKSAPLTDYSWIVKHSENYLLRVSVAKIINGLRLQR